MTLTGAIATLVSDLTRKHNRELYVTHEVLTIAYGRSQTSFLRGFDLMPDETHPLFIFQYYPYYFSTIINLDIKDPLFFKKVEDIIINMNMENFGEWVMLHYPPAR